MQFRFPKFFNFSRPNMKSPSNLLALVAAVAMTFGLSTFSVHAQQCPADLNHDHHVDGLDLAILLSAWGTSGGSGGADINGDGTIDGTDIASVLSGWGTCAPSVVPGTTRTVSGAVGAPIAEASGLAWSHSQADLFWTHNDSGDSARVFAVGWDGTIRATLPLAGVIARDIEDIALGVGPDGTEALFVADIGDNSSVRASIDVYRVAEPSVAGLPAGTTLGAVAPHVIHLTYPDGARDAEALVADRTTGDLYVITKREARSRVYRVTAAQVVAGIGVMQMVGEMPYGGVVGADACAGGTTIVVKTYDAVRVHQSPLGLAAALLGGGSTRPYVREPQGEAIAVDAACESYVTLSEGLNQPLVRYSP